MSREVWEEMAGVLQEISKHVDEFHIQLVFCYINKKNCRLDFLQGLQFICVWIKYPYCYKNILITMIKLVTNCEITSMYW
ncbi:hypothetical protein E2C01_057615 [Portunus trituberculatus]|uniref:Uncharacterized protein n=1 Tax=Portunus trituberculatus TaxID=210409 RepID=A0A5B7H2F6_PORTR|nr:hypothetical protein [Portunus trituberculatus]